MLARVLAVVIVYPLAKIGLLTHLPCHMAPFHWLAGRTCGGGGMLGSDLTYQQESCVIAKMSARCTNRQYAHGLKLESQFVPPSTNCWAVRAK